MDWNTSLPLSFSELHLKCLASISTPVGICCDATQWLYCNPALSKILHRSDGLIDSLGLEVMQWRCVWKSMTRYRQYHALDLQLSGRLQRYTLHSRRIDNPPHQPLYILEFQDKTQLFHLFWHHSLRLALQQQQQRAVLKMAQQLHCALHLSKTDSLTGIANRRAFDQHLHHIWQQTAHGSEPLSILLVDIDFFKDINDCLGHDHGDWVLHEVAQSLAYGISRSQDLVARIGGEEFGIILPNTHFEGLQIVAHQLLHRIRALNIPHPTAKAATMVTVSIGGCTLHHRLAQHSPALLLRCADQALYQCKQHGRDQACCVALSSDLGTNL